MVGLLLNYPLVCERIFETSARFLILLSICCCNVLETVPTKY